MCEKQNTIIHHYEETYHVHWLPGYVMDNVMIEDEDGNVVELEEPLHPNLHAKFEQDLENDYLESRVSFP